VDRCNERRLFGIALTLIGISILVIVWGEHEILAYSILGVAVLIMAFIFVTTSDKLKGLRLFDKYSSNTRSRLHPSRSLSS